MIRFESNKPEFPEKKRPDTRRPEVKKRVFA